MGVSYGNTAPNESTLHLMRSQLFVMPPADLYSSRKYTFMGKYPTYGYYNYLRPGLVQKIKRQRFEVALRLAKPWFYRSNAIDFGCADGVLLPSLSQYFKSVVGFEASESFVEVAQELCARLTLRNVRVVCNKGKLAEESMPDLQGESFNTAFLLETLEHVGEMPNMYETKMQFLDSLFKLLGSNGVVIVSVPKMVGILFLAKYAVQTLLRMNRERYTLVQLLKSSLLKNTNGLEPLWARGHKGFNHLKLESYLEKEFTIVQRASTVTTQLYLVRQRSATQAAPTG